MKRLTPIQRFALRLIGGIAALLLALTLLFGIQLAHLSESLRPHLPKTLVRRLFAVAVERSLLEPAGDEQRITFICETYEQPACNYTDGFAIAEAKEIIGRFPLHSIEGHTVVFRCYRPQSQRGPSRCETGVVDGTEWTPVPVSEE